jgi:hypothetical protein
MIRDLHGDDAQTFIDVIHEVCSILFLLRPSLITCPPHSVTFELSLSAGQALDLPDLQPQLRSKCLGALYRICGRQASLPRSLRIPLCYNRLDTPLYRGGFADVWRGEYQGRSVAVKALRVYSTSDSVKITSVGPRSLAKKCSSSG